MIHKITLNITNH